MAIIPDCVKDVAEEMRRKSEAIRRDFATHRPSAGSTREDLVEQFLKNHLPKRFGVSTGLIISHSGQWSKQADLVVVDDQNNAPLYPDASSKIWPVEAVYALIEVKTSLNPRDLEDAVAKGQKFKQLPRKFYETGSSRRIDDSLFVVWAFEASDNHDTVGKNIFSALKTVPLEEHPDLIVVPDSFVMTGGNFYKLLMRGQPGSQNHGELEESERDGMEAFFAGSGSLFLWLSRFGISSYRLN